MFYRCENEDALKTDYPLEVDFRSKVESLGIKTFIVASCLCKGEVTERVILSCRKETKLMPVSYRRAAASFLRTHDLGVCNRYVVEMIQDEKIMPFFEWSHHFTDEDSPVLMLSDVFNNSSDPDEYSFSVVTTEEELQRWVEKCPLRDGQSFRITERSFESKTSQGFRLKDYWSTNESVWTVKKVSVDDIEYGLYTRLETCFDIPRNQSSKKSKKTSPVATDRPELMDFGSNDHKVYKHAGKWAISLKYKPLQTSESDELFVMIAVAHALNARFDWGLSNAYSCITFCDFHTMQEASSFIDQIKVLSDG